MPRFTGFRPDVRFLGSTLTLVLGAMYFLGTVGQIAQGWQAAEQAVEEDIAAFAESGPRADTVSSTLETSRSRLAGPDY